MASVESRVELHVYRRSVHILQMGYVELIGHAGSVKQAATWLFGVSDCSSRRYAEQEGTSAGYR